MNESWAPMLIFGLLGGAVCFAVYVGYSMVSGLWQRFEYWHYNTSQPVETFPARVVGKRSETVGEMYIYHRGGSVDTYHYVTFEFTSGERREYEVSGEAYGLVLEGDEGELTFRGMEFLDFTRFDVKA